MSRTLCKTTVRVFLAVRIFTADQQLKLVGCAGIVKVTYAHLREVDITNVTLGMIPETTFNPLSDIENLD